jgi:general secretion pathway protein G
MASLSNHRSKRGYRSGKRRYNHGFTLIEMLIVISIIMILVAVAIPSYNQSIVRARESVLRQNLFTLRSLISQYTLDKQKAPQGLDDLVQGGYLKQIPNDPLTQKADWTVDQEDQTVMSPDQTDAGGVDDVHSSSTATSTDGSAYNTW